MQNTEFNICFEMSIHQNKALSEIYTFSYLIPSKQVYNAYDGFPDLLKGRYCKYDVIINKHIDNLLNMHSC